MPFCIAGLSPEPFRRLYGRSQQELAEHGARRITADRTPGFPDRVELRDAERGETLLLLNHLHLVGPSPFAASHAIYVREGAERAYDKPGEVPPMLCCRTVSLRAYDADRMMLDAVAVDGAELESEIARMFNDRCPAFLHVHNLARGCFLAAIHRA